MLKELNELNSKMAEASAAYADVSIALSETKKQLSALKVCIPCVPVRHYMHMYAADVVQKLL